MTQLKISDIRSASDFYLPILLKLCGEVGVNKRLEKLMTSYMDDPFVHK